VGALDGRWAEPGTEQIHAADCPIDARPRDHRLSQDRDAPRSPPLEQRQQQVAMGMDAVLGSES
jgi:hypothetical protein